MSISRFLLTVAATWVIIGLVVAFIMRRRGHDFYEWLVLGVFLGPLVVPLAVERARFHSIRRQPESPEPLAGRFDLLAGLDGSTEAVDALNTALRLFGGCVSTVTIVRVLDYDSLSSPRGAALQTEASEMLTSVARQIPIDHVETKVLFGRPDRAIAEYARNAGIELVVVGARGHGASEALFGSVTSRLVGDCGTPVFVGQRDGGRDTSDSVNRVRFGSPAQT